MVTYIGSPMDLLLAIEQWRTTTAAALPEHTRAALIAAALETGNARIVNTAEALYAARDALDQAGRELVAQVAMYASTYALLTLRGERGIGVRDAMERDHAAEAVDVQPGDPEPDARFVAPEEPEE